MKVFGTIYLITNLLNGKKYVGQTQRPLEERIYEHRHKKILCIDAAIDKYGWENFKVEIIEVCPVELLNDREIFWIAKLESKVPNGYNLTDGGEGCIGFTKETRLKMSAKSKGVKKSPKHRMNISLARRGTTPYENLLNEIEKRHLTYLDIANFLEISRANFSNKMRGRFHFTDKDIRKLVEIFDKPAEYLMARADGLIATELKAESFSKVSTRKRGYSPFKNLLREMDKRKLTYRSLSKLTGICKSSLPLKMSGKRKFTAAEIVKLVEIFGKPAEYLFQVID